MAQPQWYLGNSPTITVDDPKNDKGDTYYRHPDYPNELYYYDSTNDKHYQSKTFDESTGKYPTDWNEITDPNAISLLGKGKFTEYSLQSTTIKNNNPVIKDDMLEKTYQDNLKQIQSNKNYVIGNAVVQGLLNTANISNAWAKMPKSIGIPPVSNIEYPSNRGARIAELQGVMGTYGSNIRRQSMEQGWSPAIQIGAHANAMSMDLEGRTKIAEDENTNKIAELTANKEIEEKNISNQYTAETADAARRDEIEKNRSLLFSQGLTNYGKIGSGLAENLIKLQGMKSTEEVQKYAIQMMQKAQNQKEMMYWYSIYSGGGDTNKWNFDMTANKTADITAQPK